MNRSSPLATFVVGFALLIGCSRAPGPKSPQSDLVARWPAETTGGAHSATLTGNVSTVMGKVGKAFSFDGSPGGVVVADSPALNFGLGKDFSIAAWIKTEELEASFQITPIVDKRRVNGIVGAVGYALSLTYGKPALQLAPAAPTPLKFSDLFSPARLRAWWQQRKLPPIMKFAVFAAEGPDLRDNEYHHVAATVERRSKTGGKLYVDGKPVLTFDPTGQVASLANQEPLLIGAHPDPALHCPYKGTIEDVRLYSRALTPAEIEAISQKLTSR